VQPHQIPHARFVHARARATLATCISAPFGGMCGSNPPPLAVTISHGTREAGTLSSVVTAAILSPTALSDRGSRARSWSAADAAL